MWSASSRNCRRALSTPVRQVRRYATTSRSTPRPRERFDQVVLACHSDQSLALLADASRSERICWAACVTSNRVLLHGSRLMPRRRRAWSAWNYLAASERGNLPVCVTYWISKLQPLPFDKPVLVTLNPPFEPRVDRLIAEFEYSHPIVKSKAVTAQQQFAHLQGQRRTWYAGAWLGYGFHEDGLASAHLVAQGIAAGAVTAAAELAAA